MTERSAASDRLVPLVRRGQRPVCVMLPGAGGGLQPYLRLAGVLGRSHNVYGIRAAGLAPDEQPEDTIAAMAESAGRLLETAGIEPALVFGWSQGGVVGWELCVRLAERGVRPDLALLDSSPLPEVAGKDADDRLTDEITGALGPNAGAATVDRLRRTVAAQLTAGAHHRTERPYPGRVLLISCTDADPTRPAAVAAWRSLAPDLAERQVAAGHFEVLDAVHLPALVEALAPVLPAGTSPPPGPTAASTQTETSLESAL